MNDIKLKHLKNELETWLRTLSYIQQENDFLKTRLADIIRNEIGPDVLEKVEYYQTQFVNKDTIIALLRQDIAALAIKLDNKNELILHRGDILKMQDKLRTDIKYMEKRFNHLKFNFNDYMAVIL